MPFGDNAERTEAATPRRREKAREEGQTVKSREVVITAVFLSNVLFFSFAGTGLYEPALSTSILLDEQLNRRHMTVMRVSGSCRQFLCETVSRLGVATTTHMLKGLALSPNILAGTIAILSRRALRSACGGFVNRYRFYLLILSL